MNMKHNLFGRSLTSTPRLAAFTLAAATAMPLLAAETYDPVYRVTAGVGYRADADIDNTGEDFSEMRFSATATRSFTVNPRLKIDPILAYRFSAYDFSGMDLWDDIHTFRLTALANYGIDDKWSVFGGPSIAFSGEACADAGDSITYGGALGVTYRLTERMVVGGGFTASSQIEDSAQIWPLLVVNWQINDQWALESGYLEAAGGAGPGGELRYQINQSWSVAGGVQYQEKRFRLSDDADIREGVGEDSSYPIYGKVTWQVCPNGALELLGGVTVGGELLLENRNGHKLIEEDYDPAPLVGLRAILTF
jgi:hypothetical protein